MMFINAAGAVTVTTGEIGAKIMRSPFTGPAVETMHDVDEK